MSKQEAVKIDTCKYVDFDDESNAYCVFGDNSEFAYASFAVESQAWNYIENNS